VSLRKIPTVSLVANFYYAYAAMEEELERHKDHPVVSTIYFPELHRKASLEADLAYYYGPNWRDQIAMTPGGQAYVNRIREVATPSPNCWSAIPTPATSATCPGGKSSRASPSGP
jgi:heme oxygenase